MTNGPLMSKDTQCQMTKSLHLTFGICDSAFLGHWWVIGHWPFVLKSQHRQRIAMDHRFDRRFVEMRQRRAVEHRVEFT